MYFDLIHYDEFYNSLTIAGVDGTLGGRLMGTKAENNFRGKTGSFKWCFWSSRLFIFTKW